MDPVDCLFRLKGCRAASAAAFADPVDDRLGAFTQGLTLVHLSAQPKPFLSLNTLKSPEMSLKKCSLEAEQWTSVSPCLRRRMSRRGHSFVFVGFNPLPPGLIECLRSHLIRHRHCQEPLCLVPGAYTRPLFSST